MDSDRPSSIRASVLRNGCRGLGPDTASAESGQDATARRGPDDESPWEHRAERWRQRHRAATDSAVEQNPEVGRKAGEGSGARRLRRGKDSEAVVWNGERGSVMVT